MSDSSARVFGKGRACPTADASFYTSQQDNDDDDDDDVRDVRDEVRHAPERNYFLFPRVYVSRRTRRPDTDGTERTRTDDGTRLRGSSRTTPGPNRWLDGYPTDPRVLSSSSFIFSFLSRGYNYPRFNRQLLGVDRASPTPTTRRMVGLTRVNPSLFSLDAALSPPGRPTVKVRRMPIRDVATRGFCTRVKTTAHRVVFGARIRAFARRLGGGILDDFGLDAPPTPPLMDGGVRFHGM